MQRTDHSMPYMCAFETYTVPSELSWWHSLQCWSRLTSKTQELKVEAYSPGSDPSLASASLIRLQMCQLAFCKHI
jgi:hypothetical protein